MVYENSVGRLALLRTEDFDAFTVFKGTAVTWRCFILIEALEASTFLGYSQYLGMNLPIL